MNILIFSWRGPGHPNAGGAEAVTLSYAKGWVKSGNEVTLFTSSYNKSLDQEDIYGVHVIRKGEQVFGVKLAAFFWYIFGRHPKYDLVIDEFHGLPFFTPLYIRAKKIAFIHEVTKEVWALNPWPKLYSWVPAFLGTLIEPYLFKIIYRKVYFMTVSDSTKRDLLAWSIPERNVTVIPNGINVIYPKPFPKKEIIPTVVYLGALSVDKGIEDALQIFKIVLSAKKKVNFWVLGRADINYLSRLKCLMAELNLTKNVKFWGFVSEKKKYELLAKAHVLVNPSVREGWGLVVIEAAAVGTPTVGYNVPGLRDSIMDDKTGILCDPIPENCANCIVSLLEDYTKYEKFRKNALKWSKQFQWSKSIQMSLDLIRRIMR